MTYAMTPEEFLETIRLVFDCHNVFDRETIPGTFGILSDLIKKRDEAIRQAEREKYLEWQKDSALTLAAQAPAVKPTELEPNQRSKPTELEDVVLKVVMARAHTEDYPCTYEQLEQNAKWWIKVILEAARQHLAAQTPAVNSPIIQSTAAYDGTHEVFTNQTPQGDGWLPRGKHERKNR